MDKRTEEAIEKSVLVKKISNTKFSELNLEELRKIAELLKITLN